MPQLSLPASSLSPSTPQTVSSVPPRSVPFTRWPLLPLPLNSGLGITPAYRIGISSESVSRSVVSDSATECTVACQAPLSMGFSRQEYWSGLPFPSPGDLPEPGIKPTSPVSPALAVRFFTTDVYSWVKLPQNLFSNKALNISCSVLGTVLKVKSRVVVWVWNGPGVSVGLFTLVITWMTRSCLCPGSQRVGHDWATELSVLKRSHCVSLTQKMTKIQNVKPVSTERVLLSRHYKLGKLYWTLISQGPSVCWRVSVFIL